MRSILSLGIAAAAAAVTPLTSAETTVAVLEFGKGGTVRRTASAFTESTVGGVASFWKVMHRRTTRTVQHAGMTVVPDLFNRADAGVVVGISASAADLAAMPTVMSLLGEGSPEVVGHVHVPGQVSEELMNRAAKGIVSVSDESLFGKHLQSSAQKVSNGIEGIDAISLSVESNAAAAEADKQLQRMLETLDTQATKNGKTVVLHLVVQEEGGSSRRKLESSSKRRLEEGNNQGQNNNANNNGDANGNAYVEVGDKTMFQIQYFNVVLWTALGLFTALSMTIGSFIGMPLMADTLLFGESAKMIGSD